MLPLDNLVSKMVDMGFVSGIGCGSSSKKRMLKWWEKGADIGNRDLETIGNHLQGPSWRTDGLWDEGWVGGWMGPGEKLLLKGTLFTLLDMVPTPSFQLCDSPQGCVPEERLATGNLMVSAASGVSPGNSPQDREVNQKLSPYSLGRARATMKH